MPAPSLDKLFELEPIVEREFQRRLNLRFAGVIETFRPRESATFPEKRIQLEFVQGEALAHLRPMGDGTFLRDAWNYVLKMSLFTQRDQPDSDIHGQLRGQIKNLVQQLRYDATFLDWYVLTTLVPQSASESIQIGQDSDVSTLQWRGWICIRPDAWPD